jgi:hypothetical protein
MCRPLDIVRRMIRLSAESRQVGPTGMIHEQSAHFYGQWRRRSEARIKLPEFCRHAANEVYDPFRRVEELGIFRDLSETVSIAEKELYLVERIDTGAHHPLPSGRLGRVKSNEPGHTH